MGCFPFVDCMDKKGRLFMKVEVWYDFVCPLSFDSPT